MKNIKERDNEHMIYLTKEKKERIYYPVELKGEEAFKYYDNAFRRAKDLANKVSKGTANNSLVNRDYKTILGNCLAGIISEDMWRIFLNDYSYKNNYVSQEKFDEDKFKKQGIQIDLKINRNNKKIEVRSSFIKNNPIHRSLNNLNIIGAYKNNYKKGEEFKDYHVLALFEGTPEDLINNIKSYNKLKLYLAGGVTKQMLINNSNKGSLSNNKTKTKSNYTLIPINESIDPLKLKKEIQK